MLPSNTLLNSNRYRIVRPLGRGGMGHVYEAIDTELAKIVAIKETFADNDEMREAFRREAKLLANLDHPALPKVSSHFFEGNGQFLVMDYIEGTNLLELLEAHKQLAPHEHAFYYKVVLMWADTLLEVLEYLHNRSEPIIHRDIKPTNIKRSTDGKIYLLDFGLAKGAAGQMTTIRDGRGLVSIYGYSEPYAPMEQMSRSGTDPQSDLYALGATVYHLLTGIPPISASKRYEQVDRGKPDPIVLPDELNPAIPPSISRVVLHALAVSRKDRMASATEMRRAFQDAMLSIEATGDDKQPAALPPARAQERIDTDPPPEIGALLPTEILPAPLAPSANKPDGLSGDVAVSLPSLPPTIKIDRPPDNHSHAAPLIKEEAAPETPAQSPNQANDARAATDDAQPRAAEVEPVNSQLDGRHEEEQADNGDESSQPVIIAPQADELNGEEDAAAEPADALAAQVESVDGDDDERAFKEEEAIKLRQRWVADVEQHRKRIAEAAEAALQNRAQLEEEEIQANELSQEPQGMLLDDEQEEDPAGRKPFTRLQKQILMGVVALALVGIAVIIIARSVRSGSNNNANTASSSPTPAASVPPPAATPQPNAILNAASPVATQILKGQQGGVWAVAASADGNLLASGGKDGNVRVWDARTKELRHTLAGHRGDVYSIAFSPDGKTLASAGKDRAVRLWDAERGTQIKTLAGHLDEVYHVAFSPDGSKLASAGEDKTIKLWDVRAQQLTGSLQHAAKVWAVAFSPDKPVLVGVGEDKIVRRWNIDTGLELTPSLQGHSGAVLSVAFSPDGRFLVSGSKDGIIKVWDATSWQLLATLEGHKGFVTSLAFSPDNKVMASAGMDRTLRLWNVERWTPIQSLTENSKGVTSVAFPPDGRTLISGGEDATVRLWEWS